ncbi:DUF4347 domain-containing protein [Pedobacter cryoconitis]|nr:DUF4347 domain-containing protein [Pedobacter cryoconitis]
MANSLSDSMRHSTTQQLVLNINNKLLEMKVIRPPALWYTSDLRITEMNGAIIKICGHGNEGQLETGYGQGVASEENIIHASYQSGLEYLKQLKMHNTKLVKIYSCNTGAGMGGSILLFLLAKMWGVPVQARTGITRAVNKGSQNWMEFEENSTWQMATPTMEYPPPPILNVSMISAPLLHDINIDAGIDFESVLRIQAKIIEVNKPSKNKIINDQVKAFLLGLFKSDIFYADGEFPGQITTVLTIFCANGSIEMFTIYCDSIAIIEHKNLSFYVNPNSIQWLKSL